MTIKRKINSSTPIWIVAGAAIIFWLDLTKLFSGLSFYTKLSYIVTIEAFAWQMFERWGWKFRVFRGWLVAIPNLNGTWKGTIKSSWKNPDTGKVVDAIDAELMVKQTYSHVSCTMKTGEIKSQSFAADIIDDPNSGAISLVYSYAGVPDPTIRGRSPIHFGTAKLEVIGAREDALEGEYWTTRETKGLISLKKIV